MNTLTKKIIGFGGSCHWCTEAIFQSLKGVVLVEQGWIRSQGEHTAFSEAVLVHFQPAEISLDTLVDVHLHTHSCTARHSMRSKYRSAVYTFDEEQNRMAGEAILALQKNFDKPIITQVIPFAEFKLNQETYLDYYYRNPDKPFCKNVVNPKLQLLLKQFSKAVDSKKLQL